MEPSNANSLDALSVEDLDYIDRVCLAYEAGWQGKESLPPRIEEAWPVNVPERLRFLLFRELLKIDLAYRTERHLEIKANVYLPRFSEFQDFIDAVLKAQTSPGTSLDGSSTVIAPVPRNAKVRGNIGNSVDEGSLLANYEILETIAQGGMGVVYRARQRGLNRIVALKMILSGRFATDEVRKRFFSEAALVASLEHSHIVPVFEIGEDHGQPFFSMAYISGPSLKQRLNDGPMLPQKAAELMRTVAVAMEYAHRHGVIHRDLKPANILIDGQGQPRITDFGLAKQLVGDTSLTASGEVLGTPSYMPPEQARGEVVGTAADVYSMGATLYCMLTGRPPFQASSTLETLRQVIHEEVLSPKKLNPQVPRELETICLKCLNKDPNQRYSSAKTCADDLDRFLTGRPILARPASYLEHAVKWGNRNRSICIAGMISIVMGILGVGVWIVERYRQVDLVTNEIVKQLLSADSTSLPAVLQECDQAPRVIETKLKRAIEKADPDLHWRFQMALLPTQKECRFGLLSRMLRSDVTDANIIAHRLKGYLDNELGLLWKEVAVAIGIPETGDDTCYRLILAAMVLSVLDPDSGHWGEPAICNNIAIAATSLPIEALSLWNDKLRFPPAAKPHLAAGWAGLLRMNIANPDVIPFFLASVAEIAPEPVIEGLSYTDGEEFDHLFNELSKLYRPERLQELIRTEIHRRGNEPPDGFSFGCRATLALALARAGDPSLLIARLIPKADNTERTFLMMRAAAYKVPRETILETFCDIKKSAGETTADSSKRRNAIGQMRALLIILGTYRVPDVPKSMITAIEDVYTTIDDGGVHSAAEWTLRQCDSQRPSISANPNRHGHLSWRENTNGHILVRLEPREPVRMGSPLDETRRDSAEHLHLCRISHPFWIATTETTVQQYQQFLAIAPQFGVGFDRAYAPTDDCPRIGISYVMAAAYCNWLSEREGLPPIYVLGDPSRVETDVTIIRDRFHGGSYRLPTEGEWEYSCRAESQTAYCCGGDETMLDHFCWFLNNADDRSHSVGEKVPNDFGLFDTHGNVWEWCSGEPSTYPTTSEMIVDDPVPSASVSTESFRIQRGGSFAVQPRYARSAFRDLKRAVDRSGQWGFRIVKTATD